MVTFDATVDFETELNAELARAWATRPMATLDCRLPVTAVVRCDSEMGELYSGDEELPALVENDMVATARSVNALASALRAAL